MIDKRELVEEYLSSLCLEIELCEQASDPYDCDEKDHLLLLGDGLIHYVEYEPGSEEWENFYPEGWLYKTPTNAQVEKLYPKAIEHFEIDEGEQ